MTVEQRLVDALHSLDNVEPSLDLFARVERSLADDRVFRRRRLTVIAVSLIILGSVIALVWTGIDAGGDVTVDAWRLVVGYLTLAGGLIVGLAPNIRRFARSFVDDVFRLSPETGGRFLGVLDIAYYATFVGLALVDADGWHLGDRVDLFPALDEVFYRLGFLLLAMGLLHTVNLILMPVIGLIFNSIVRGAARFKAGAAAPHESLRAKIADRNARSFAIGLIVLAVALLFTLMMGPIGGLVIGWLE